jgi:superfamily II DNA/RNA helicase
VDLRADLGEKLKRLGHVARMGDKGNAYRIFGGKSRIKEATGKTKT